MAEDPDQNAGGEPWQGDFRYVVPAALGEGGH